MQIILFDSPTVRTALLPLTYARPVAGLRCGMLTTAECWRRRTDSEVAVLTQDYLQPDFPLAAGDDNLFVDGSLRPTVELLSLLPQLEPNSGYTLSGELVLLRADRSTAGHFISEGTAPDHCTTEPLPHLPLLRFTRPADLFLNNDRALREDFELLTAGRTSTEVSATNTIIGPRDQLFLEPGVTLEACTINVSSGPVYLGREAVVLEGCLLRGPVAAGAGAVLKMGTKVYGATTLGPSCKVGGEINNVVFQAHSNKGHEGFLGNAVVGEWCNIGADTNASNLKNDYGEVKVWSYAEEAMIPSGLQFHGLILGDHSKVGINTMFNTGTVVGYSCNVFGAGFPPSFLPSFTWGGAESRAEYRLDRALDTAERMIARRGRIFGERERAVFTRIFEDTARFR
ncbi:putative sugar nucleotidyl transferase [Lewinella sp. IMCC34183]|uniref:putative sugar nucleotidyl transferase n=1 Tax=Lewinella sp. IMCC34183 TaxID=2248762 RepID=UPI000E239766|nr:putative sugar nucleotidyl transferase [Lewinella sp. IMCC34183]